MINISKKYNPKYTLVKISELRQHEEIDSRHFLSLLEAIKKNRYIEPILVEESSKVILDGHHRFNAMKKLGFNEIPAHLVDYANIEVRSWRPEVKVTKAEVIRRGLSGELFPPQTSRHICELEIEKIMLEELR